MQKTKPPKLKRPDTFISKNLGPISKLESNQKVLDAIKKEREMEKELEKRNLNHVGIDYLSKGRREALQREYAQAVTSGDHIAVRHAIGDMLHYAAESREASNLQRAEDLKKRRTKKADNRHRTWKQYAIDCKKSHPEWTAWKVATMFLKKESLKDNSADVRTIWRIIKDMPIFKKK